MLRVTGEEPPADPAAEAPLAWTLLRADGRRWLGGGAAEDPAASAEAGADAWWRLLFNALPADGARLAFATHGDERLLAPPWRARSVMV